MIRCCCKWIITTFCDHVFILYKANIALSVAEGQPEAVNQSAKFQILTSYADACYFEKEYKFAEVK